MAFVGIQPSPGGSVQTLNSGAPQVLTLRLSAGRPRIAREGHPGQGGRRWLVTCAAVALSTMKKRGKDPERPRRPMTAYLRFMTDYRAKRNGVAPAQLCKQGGQEWNSMSTEAKQYYESKATADFIAYREAMGQYRSSGRLEAWKRDPSRPHKPLNPYVRFFLEQKKKTPDATFSKTGPQWKHISAAEKSPFVNAYHADLAKYKKMMARYKASDKEEKWKSDVGIKALEDQEDAKKKRARAEALALKQKEKAKREAKALVLRQKERAKHEKNKARALARKEREKAKQEKEKAKAKTIALKQKERAREEKEKAKRDAKALVLRQKERAKKEKNKARALALKQKEKEKAKALARKEREKAKQEKEKANAKKERAREEKEKAKALALKQKQEAKKEKARPKATAIA